MLGVLDSRVTLSLSVYPALCEDYYGAAGQKIAGSKKSLLILAVTRLTERACGQG